MKLYTYWRSSAAYRVRIALNLKGIGADLVPIHLVRDGGEQHAEAYRSVNPNELVPALVLDDGTSITQSVAIVEYLDEVHGGPRLLPDDPKRRARVRSAALTIACDIHPINNLRVITHLKKAYGRSQSDIVDWMAHWMTLGLHAYRDLIEPTGTFSFGETPSLADACLVPQLYNAKRWNIDIPGIDRLREIEAACLALPAFAAAVPERQPDAE